MQKYLFILLTLLLASSLGAQTKIDSSELSVSQTESSTDKLNPSDQMSKNQFNFSLQSHSYLESSAQVDSSEQVFNFEHKYNLNEKRDSQISAKHSLSSHLIFGGYTKNQSVYAAIPQIYYKYTDQEVGAEVTKNIVIGRKLLNQSQLNESFHLGLTNSFFTQDFINFESQGLVGIHPAIEAKNWGFEISLLPVYLPNQQPTFKEENGRIKGSNRWFKQPPTHFVFNEIKKEIIYDIDYGRVSELVMTSGASAQLRLGQVKDHIYWINSFSRRPMNELVLERETFATLDAVARVNLVPNVIYDRIYTSDLRFESHDLKLAISYIADQPENKIARANHSIQKLEGLSGYGISLQAQSLFLQKDIQYGFSVAEFKGGQIRDVNFDGTENIFTLSKQRLQYKKPIQFFVDSELTQLSHKRLKVRTNWLYDFEQKGSILSTVFTLQTFKKLEAHLGFDVLGTEEQKNADYEFLQQFQSNDRIYGGLEYVF